MKEALWKYCISSQIISLMIEEGRAKYPKETGGILIGWQHEQVFYIKMAIGPGPNASHKNFGFKRDGDFSQSQLNSIVFKTRGQWDYIGEWHSHPRNMGPSSTDIASLRKVQTSPKFNILQPILGLIINTGNEWRFHCYLQSQNRLLIEIPRREADTNKNDQEITTFFKDQPI